jgi:hypothetical protein
MSTVVKTATPVVASGTNAAGATTRGRIELKTGFGGILTANILNGPTGPTVQCVCNVLVAHNATQPAEASAGADWKLAFSVGGGTANNGNTPIFWTIPAGVMQLEIEFTGNTAQSVTIEAFVSEVSSIT